MQENTITIESIYNGQSASYLSGGDYLSSIAIDPDADVSSTIQKIAGTLSPISHETLSVIDGNPMWILPNSKTDEHLIYTDTGKVYFLDGNLDITGSVITLTDASGNGAVYYNGYYYLIKDTDLDRIKCDDKEHEIDLLANRTSKTYKVVSSQSQSTTGTSLTFGNGQGYSKVTHQFPITYTAVPFGINRLKLKMVASAGTHTIRIRYMNGGTDESPDTATTLFTTNVTVTTNEQIYTISNTLFIGGSQIWIVIDKETLFGTGEFITVSSTNTSAIPGANTRGYNGTDWLIPPGTLKKNLSLQMYSEVSNTVQLNNVKYPMNGLTRLPNHTAFVAGNDNFYVSDVSLDNIGNLHTFKSFGVVRLYDFNANTTIQANSVITGSTSKAEATITRLIEIPFTGIPKGESGNPVLAVFNPKGAFIEDEVISISGTSIGYFESFSQGEDLGTVDFNTVRLPIDHYPTSLSNIGTDISILAIKSQDDTINQGYASMFLWDTFDSTFYREIKLPFPNASALLTHNGFPFLWGGDTRGYSFSLYRGGDQIDELYYVDDGLPPFAGAVHGENNRVLWGTNTTYPEVSGSIMAFGSRNGLLPKGVHNIARTPNNKQVTSFALATKGSNNIVIGSEDLLAQSGGNANSVFRTNLYSIPRKFNVKSVAFTIAGGVTDNTDITITTYVDNETLTKSVNVVNSDNYEIGTKKIVVYPDLQGEANFFIELKWTASNTPIQLPLKIQVTQLEQ